MSDAIDDPTFRIVYLKLDEAAFRTLVRGDEAVLVSQDGKIQAHLILADIGWARMLVAIDDAMQDKAPDEERR